jgi:serine protease inhibitor
MRATLRSLLFLASTLLYAACAESPITGPIIHLPRDLTAGETQLVSADNRFAFTLFRTIAAQEPTDANLFISPLSVGMALGMTVNGAAGATRDSMLSALQLGGLPMDEVNRGYRGIIDLLRGLDPGVEFTLANSIWYRTGITVGQAFLNDVRTWFDADVQAIDFSAPTAARTINDWVSAQTRGRIDTIVDDPIPSGVIMYLINAIYFKGSWTQQFDPSLTHDAPFNLRNGGTVSASTMTHADPAPARLYQGDGVTVVDLPYGGRAWSMTIVLPDSPAGIDTLPAALTGERWNAWMAALDTTGVIVTMPKFKLTYRADLNAVLAALGMGTAFCDSRMADFSRLMPGALPGDVCISNVEHKTYVDVYEEGTEAAAVTSVEITATAMPSGPLHITVNRPFLVAIRERLTGTILFLGKVMNPVAN